MRHAIAVGAVLGISLCLSACTKSKSAPPSNDPWLQTTADLDDRIAAQQDAPRLVVMRLVQQFWNQRGQQLVDVTAEESRSHPIRAITYHVWGERSAVLAVLRGWLDELARTDPALLDRMRRGEPVPAPLFAAADAAVLEAAGQEELIHVVVQLALLAIGEVDVGVNVNTLERSADQYTRGSPDEALLARARAAVELPGSTTVPIEVRVHGNVDPLFTSFPTLGALERGAEPVQGLQTPAGLLVGTGRGPVGPRYMALDGGRFLAGSLGQVEIFRGHGPEGRREFIRTVADRVATYPAAEDAEIRAVRDRLDDPPAYPPAKVGGPLRPQAMRMLPVLFGLAMGLRLRVSTSG